MGGARLGGAEGWEWAKGWGSKPRERLGGPKGGRPKISRFVFPSGRRGLPHDSLRAKTSTFEVHQNSSRRPPEREKRMKMGKKREI